jgi:hypothetical protein
MAKFKLFSFKKREAPIRTVTKTKKEYPFAPDLMMAVYLPATLLVVMGAAFLFPGEAAPLEYFSVRWRLVSALLSGVHFFPYLVISALVGSFGFPRLTVERYASFSLEFVDAIRGHVVAAIASSALYALIYLLVYPLALDYKASLTFDANLYHTSRERAAAQSADENWREAAQFMSICERIWPQNDENRELHNKIALGLEAERYEDDSAKPRDSEQKEPAAEALTGTQAFALAQQAFNRERYYEAHWYATLAGRLTRQGSAEAAAIARLAAESWNKIASPGPSSQTQEQYSIYHRKQEGYNALISGDWIRAYYIFKELREEAPGDEDTVDFLSRAEDGLKENAFFLDEINMAIGESLSGSVFSLPWLSPQGNSLGRMVMSFSSLSNIKDYSYAIGIEILRVDQESQPVYRVKAPYGKILPLRLESTAGGDQCLLLMRALDRGDQSRRWEPVWEPAESGRTDGFQMILPVSYSDFLLASEARQGLSSLSAFELMNAMQRLGDKGFIVQTFQYEILNRIGESILLLPMAIFAIVIGWRFRALTKLRVFGFMMMAIIPTVISVAGAFFRQFQSYGVILAVANLDFSLAVALLAAEWFVLFGLSLIILAAQHG